MFIPNKYVYFARIPLHTFGAPHLIYNLRFTNWPQCHQIACQHRQPEEILVYINIDRPGGVFIQTALLRQTHSSMLLVFVVEYFCFSRFSCRCIVLRRLLFILSVFAGTGFRLMDENEMKLNVRFCCCFLALLSIQCA